MNSKLDSLTLGLFTSFVSYSMRWEEYPIDIYMLQQTFGRMTNSLLNCLSPPIKFPDERQSYLSGFETIAKRWL